MSEGKVSGPPQRGYLDADGAGGGELGVGCVVHVSSRAGVVGQEDDVDVSPGCD